MKRRILLSSVASALLVSATRSVDAASESFPSRPLRLIVAKPAGGAYDTIARKLAEKLSESWGQPVIVDNRPGAGDMVGTAFVAKAPGDGYTLLLSASGIAQNPSIYPKMPYEPKDLSAVAKLHEIPYALVINRSLGVSTLDDFVRRAKAENGKLSYATISSSSQVVGEIFKLKAGVDMVRVPYRGEQPALTDLLGGQVSAAFLSAGTAVRYPDRVAVLAVTGKRRIPGLNVPTMAESGYTDLELVSWGGIFVPSTTPAPLQEKIGKEMMRIGTLPDVVARTVDLGFVPSVEGPAEFTRFVELEMDFWKHVTKQFNIVAG